MARTSLYRSPTGEQEVMALYDTMLERWPVPHEEVRVSTRHGETFVILSGNPSSPALVLLHGISSNAVSWMDDIIEYSHHFRVYAVDIPGDPGKSAIKRISLNNHAQTEWMEDLLNILKIPRANLLGISLGGWTALRYAVDRPERIIKLVVLTPAGVVSARISFLVKAVCLSILGSARLRNINRLTNDPNSIHPETLKFMNTVMTHFKVKLGRIHTFTDSELRRLNMPTLLLCGQQDAVQNVERIASRMNKLIKNLATVMYPQKGHVLNNITSEIIPFLISNP